MSEQIAATIAARQRFTSWWIPAVLVDPFRRCPHLHQRGIYGDEIWATMRWSGAISRARCLDCGRLLPDLPPAAAVVGDAPVPEKEGER